MNEDTSPERTITVTLTEMEFGALAGAISKAMDHWDNVGGQANWLNDQIAKAWEKVLKAWFPTHDAKKMREGYETLFGDIPFDPETGWSNKPNDPVDSDSDGTVDIAPVIDLFKKSG